jgi:Family of unknown function (DUF6527)
MNWIARLFTPLFDRCSTQTKRVWAALQPSIRIEPVSGALPRHLGRRKLYVVSEDGYDEQAAMICPCGCKQVLHMNLLTDERPCWTVRQEEDGTPTLHPSVWRKKGCGSHFWLRRGRVIWC